MTEVIYIGMYDPPKSWHQPLLDTLVDLTKDLKRFEWLDGPTLKVNCGDQGWFVIVSVSKDDTRSYKIPRGVDGLSARVRADQSVVPVNAEGAVDWYLTQLLLMPYDAMRFMRDQGRLIVQIRLTEEECPQMTFEFSA